MMECDDTILRDHFHNSLKNAMYSSPSCQNYIITAIGKIMQRQVDAHRRKLL
jgi:hypothetical protein